MKRILLTVIIVSAALGHVFAEDFHESRLNKGLRNTDLYSYYLIEKGHNEPARIVEYIEKARSFSPDLPAVYFHLAWVTFTTSPAKIYDGIYHLIAGVNAYGRNFWWSFNLTGTIFISLLMTFFCTMLIIVLVRLPIDLPLINHEIKEDGKNFIILILAFFISAMGPLYFIAAMFLIISLYFKKRDLVVTYIFFAVLMLLPLFLKSLEIFMAAELSPSLNAIVAVNEGRDNDYALLKHGKKKEEIFSRALARKREGRIKEAIADYESVLDKYHDRPTVYNNIGNCYAILKRYDKAKDMYRKALEIEPTASTLYNLSQMSREMLDFETGDGYFDEANKIDSDAVAEYRKNTSRAPNRFYIDDTLRHSDFWLYAVKYSNLNMPSGTFVPKWFTPVIGLMLIVTFTAFSRIRGNKAFRCKRCGTIICSNCERSLKWGNMCNDCFTSLVTLEKDPKIRIAKITRVYESKRKKRTVVRLLSLMIPGAQFLYGGKIIKGTFLTTVFIIPPVIFLVSLFYRISIYPFIHTWLLFILICIEAVLLIANVFISRRFLKKWL